MYYQSTVAAILAINCTTVTQKMDKSPRSWPGVILGSFFLFPGLFAGYFVALKPSIAYLSSSDWQQVPATIINLEKKYSRSSRSDGNKVIGEYVYQYNGQTLRSKTVSIYEASDNFGDYWDDLHTSLNLQRRNDTVNAWVNPDNPSESVLDRSFRWTTLFFGFLFATIFGAVGGYLMWHAWTKKSTGTGVATQHAPTKGISSNEKYSGLLMLFIGMVCTGFGSVMTYIVIQDEVKKDNYLALLVSILAFAGLWITYLGVKIILAYRRFGPTPLRLSPDAPGVGGEFGAWFVVPARSSNKLLQAEPELRATLSCISVRKSGKSTSRTQLWQTETPVYTSLAANGLKAEFKVDIPKSCKPTENLGRGSKIEWIVDVEGDFQSSDLGEFKRSWPVFANASPATEQSSVTIPANFLTSAEQKDKATASQSALRQINVNEEGHVLRLHSSAGRYTGSSLFGIFIGATFAIIGKLVHQEVGWIGYIFIAMGLLIAFLCLTSWLGGLRCSIDKHTKVAKITRFFAGIAYSTKEYSIGAPDQLYLKRTSASRRGNKTTEFYALYLRANGGKHKLAKAIEGKAAAEALKGKVLSALF